MSFAFSPVLAFELTGQSDLRAEKFALLHASVDLDQPPEKGISIVPKQISEFPGNEGAVECIEVHSEKRYLDC